MSAASLEIRNIFLLTQRNQKSLNEISAPAQLTDRPRILWKILVKIRTFSVGEENSTQSQCTNPQIKHINTGQNQKETLSFPS